MKVNRLKKIWIIIKSLWVTFIGSSNILFKTFIGKCSREEADNLIKKWATRILKIIELSYEISNPYDVTLDPDHCYSSWHSDDY